MLAACSARPPPATSASSAGALDPRSADPRTARAAAARASRSRSAESATLSAAPPTKPAASAAEPPSSATHAPTRLGLQHARAVAAAGSAAQAPHAAGSKFSDRAAPSGASFPRHAGRREGISQHVPQPDAAAAGRRVRAHPLGEAAEEEGGTRVEHLQPLARRGS